MLQTKNKREFIPDKPHKQNLPPYQQKVFLLICNFTHFLSTLLNSGLQRNDQCRTHSLRLLPLLSNLQR